jgi:hypothetical protein
VEDRGRRDAARRRSHMAGSRHSRPVRGTFWPALPTEKQQLVAGRECVAHGRFREKDQVMRKYYQVSCKCTSWCCSRQVVRWNSHADAAM